MSFKTCPGYGGFEAHTEPLDAFGDNKSRSDGKSVYCKRCAALAQKAWRQAHPDTVRRLKRMRREKARQEQVSVR